MLGAILGGASLLSGILGANASKDAANSQRDAANNANDLQRYMYDTSRKDMEPYRDYGLSALDRLNGFDPGRSQNEQRRKFLEDKIKAVQANQGYWQSVLNGGAKADGEREGWQYNLNTSNKEFEDYSKELAGLKDYGTGLSGVELGNSIMSQDPGYQFRLDQGNKAINAAASARGRAMGGATLKELGRYGQDYASNEYGNAYNRLAAQAGIGQAATNNLANLGQSYGQQYGQNQAAIGNANAAQQIGQANAWGGAIQGIGNAYMNGSIMDSIFKKPSSGGYTSPEINLKYWGSEP